MKTRNDRIYALSLMTISLCTLALSIKNLLGIELPDIARVLLVCVELTAAAGLLYASVKKMTAGK